MMLRWRVGRLRKTGTHPYETQNTDTGIFAVFLHVIVALGAAEKWVDNAQAEVWLMGHWCQAVGPAESYYQFRGLDGGGISVKSSKVTTMAWRLIDH